MREIDAALDALANSRFRRSNKLEAREAEYLASKGIDTVIKHAAEFVESRLAPARPANDGKQTPWHGLPVFVAQHATATCCRSCLAKWHFIEKGRALSEEEKRYVVEVIRRWLTRPIQQHPRPTTEVPEQR
jgi:hypothetical protein